MKFLLLIPLMVVGLLLGGCETITPQQAQTTATKVVATVKTVQTYTQQVCKFLPTAATIISLFNAGVGGSVDPVGGAICDAVTTNPLADGDEPGYYNVAKVRGVVIKGKFVK